MTIDEAIRLIQDDLDHNYYELDSPLEKAVKLGIEALKRILDVRRFPEASNWKPLPGEGE